MLLVVVCAAVLWLKLDAISRNLAEHVHGGAEASDRFTHTHADGTTHSHPSENPAHQHGPFHAASHPPSGDLQLAPEWAAAKLLALALPDTFAQDTAYLKLLGDIAQACLEKTDVEVLLVVEQNDVSGRAAWDAVVRQRQLDRKRLEFYEAKALDSIWLKDYGPIFVRRRDDGQLFVVDAAYRDLRMLTEETAGSLLGLGPTLRPADDLAPIYFATLLGKPFVHPGFALNGGDVYADGQGMLYTSEETVHLNTGDKEFLDTAFRQFFGVRQTCYLRSLPGPTVKHIDMLFKLISPTTCLVGQYAESSEEGELASLQRAAAEALDANAERLAALGLRVARMPMPDIGRITRWDYFGRIFSDSERDERIRQLAAESEVDEEQIRGKLRQRQVYVYRTFLNSILLVSKTGARKLLLVPHYPGVVPAEMEEQALAAYRDAYGEDIEIALIDAESLAHGNGSLRCIACPVPAE
jgi:agmatine/peptidylarginine deiminase